MDCSPPGSSVHGILQARIPEWVPIPFSRGSSSPGVTLRGGGSSSCALSGESPQVKMLVKQADVSLFSSF